MYTGWKMYVHERSIHQHSLPVSVHDSKAVQDINVHT